jgi:Tfp pilus assembly protein PilO
MARQALSAYMLPPERPQDFTAHLPVSPPMADVMQNLHRACAQAGVVLAGVQATHRPASAQQLARIELTVLLRGPYTGARAALDAVLERHSALTLQRLRMRRTTSPTDLETSATLSLWGRASAGEAS